MFRSMASKVAWVGRTASMVFGLALVLALILGVGTMAAAAVPGDPFKLGQSNRVDELTVLASTLAGPVLRVDNDGSGPALDLRVGDPRTDPFDKTVAPMKVDSQAKVDSLNAGRLDGKTASKIGVNSLRVGRDQSDADSSPSKRAIARCPNGRDGDLVVVGTGYRIKGAPNGSVVMVQLDTFAPRDDPNRPFQVVARAVETEPVAANWSVEAEPLPLFTGVRGREIPGTSRAGGSPKSGPAPFVCPHIRPVPEKSGPLGDYKHPSLRGMFFAT